jgi:hypothetical protein
LETGAERKKGNRKEEGGKKNKTKKSEDLLKD